MYLHALQRQPLAIGTLQHRRRSLDQYGDYMGRRYRREPYELEHRLARRHYSEPPPTPGSSDKLKTVDEATVGIVKVINKDGDSIATAIRHVRKELVQFAAIDLASAVRRSARFFDKKIFSGILHNHVKLVLDDAKGELMADSGGKTKISPDGTNITVTLCLPQLQAMVNAKKPKVGLDHAWAVLLHQLIHAYFLVVCGVQKDGKDPDGRLKHGEHFGCVMYKILDVFNGLIPLGFGHQLFVSNRRAAVIEPTREAFYRINGYKNVRRFSTECPRDVEVIKKEKIDDWYKKKCIKAVDPDIYIFDLYTDTLDTKPFSKSGNKKDWVELVLNKKSYKLDRKANFFACVKNKFEDDKRKLDIPSWVEVDVLKSFISFLNRGHWNPDLSEVQNGTKGPPLLLKYSHTAETNVQHDIAMYQLGCCLQIEDLKRKALVRLSCHHFTYESGHDIVRAIYCDPPTPPDDGLRHWARRFFQRHSEPKPGCQPIDSSNWKILQGDIVFQTGYFGSGQSAMRADMNKAENELRKLGEEVAISNDPYARHVCSAHCAWSNCAITHQRMYGVHPPHHHHHALVPHAYAPPPPLPPCPPPATYIQPPTYVPPPPPAAIAYTPRPHVALPAYWTLSGQMTDHAWIAVDTMGQHHILRRHHKRWMPYPYHSDGYHTVGYDYDPWNSDDGGYVSII